jgi:PAS domain S-box-containing protein
LNGEAVAIENALGDLLDNAPCGFVSFRDDGGIVHVNATLLERLGYEREELCDRHVETVLAMGSRIFYQTHFFPLLKLQGRAREVFMLLRGKNGDDVGMLCNAVRRQRDGVGVTDCVLMEVIERRKFEEALLQARHAAEDANHAKSNFLAVMSHELRTPLNAIGGYVQLLTMGIHGPVTPQQEEALGRVERSQRHLLRLINDVLNLARIEAGRVEYVVRKVALSDIVTTTLPMVEPQIASKELNLQTAVPAVLSANADREKVQQILLNLLTNAVKFTPNGGTLRIEAGHVDASKVYLSVSDTGVGIPPSMIDKVFEPFMQVDTNQTARSEGTGLGLAISRDLARGMGGDLTARSQQGVGSVFTLALTAA